MPPYTPAFDTSLAQPCSDLKTRWLEWKEGPSPFGPDDLANFTSGQKIEFLAQLVELEPSLSASAVGAMEEAYGLAASTNSEIKFRWIRLGLRARSEPAVDLAVQMVTEQGRMKFLRYTLRIFDSFFMLNTFKYFLQQMLFCSPIYRDMYAWEEKRQVALDTYNKVKNTYMHVARDGLEKILHIN